MKFSQIFIRIDMEYWSHGKTCIMSWKDMEMKKKIIFPNHYVKTENFRKWQKKFTCEMDYKRNNILFEEINKNLLIEVLKKEKLKLL